MVSNFAPKFATAMSYMADVAGNSRVSWSSTTTNLAVTRTSTLYGLAEASAGVNVKDQDYQLWPRMLGASITSSPHPGVWIHMPQDSHGVP